MELTIKLDKEQLETILKIIDESVNKAVKKYVREEVKKWQLIK